MRSQLEEFVKKDEGNKETRESGKKKRSQMRKAIVVVRGTYGLWVLEPTEIASSLSHLRDFVSETKELELRCEKS